MKNLICRLFHRKHHYADYEGRHIVNKKGSYRCMGCYKCNNGWYEKRPPMHTACAVFGHRFYQGIAGYSSDGTPYPGKFCYNCDYTEEILNYEETTTKTETSKDIQEETETNSSQT